MRARARDAPRDGATRDARRARDDGDASGDVDADGRGDDDDARADDDDGARRREPGG